MNHKLFTTLSSLTISSALLVVGLMANGEATRLSGTANDSRLVESIETGAIQATEDVVAPVERKHRRGRSSLSMPYFSFAQSLRPRG
ncbi:MAG: hypothetical protein ABWZ08_06560 [Pseudoxanthomonas sp.]